MNPVAIGVLTSPRRGASYLLDTVGAIHREGGSFCSRTVFLDENGESSPDQIREALVSAGFPGWSVEPIGFSLGTTEATRRALVAAAGGRRDMIFMEDDLAISRNGVERMLCTQVPPDCGMVSFFDMKEFGPGTAAGLYRLPPSGDGRGFWGNQCLRIPADVLAWLSEQDWKSTSLGDRRSASDEILGELIGRHPTRNQIGHHIPCLVEHVGLTSACMWGLDLTGRTATNFIGAGDAAALPAFA